MLDTACGPDSERNPGIVGRPTPPLPLQLSRLPRRAEGTRHTARPPARHRSTPRRAGRSLCAVIAARGSGEDARHSRNARLGAGARRPRHRLDRHGPGCSASKPDLSLKDRGGSEAGAVRGRRPADRQSGMIAGAAARMSGFIAHLRRHGVSAGPAETELVLSVLAADEVPGAATIRLALKTLLSGNREQWARFDELFDAYWFGRGVRIGAPAQAEAGARNRSPRPKIWDKALPREETASAMGRAEPSQRNGDGPEGSGTGRLIASRSDALSRTDLRTLITPEEAAEAERIAERLARAIRYRLSRRRTPARRGEMIDIRRTIRCNLSRGGEPLELRRK